MIFSQRSDVLVKRLRGGQPRTIAEGGQLVQARDRSWAPLIFQDLFKKEQ
jgi:hypothetical protein